MRLRTSSILILASCGSVFPQTVSDPVQRVVQQSMAARQQLIETLKQGIVRVEAQKDMDDTGTGIMISSSPERIRILTALHVVDGAKSINVVFYSDRMVHVPARRLPAQSDTLDLAVLEVTPGSGTRMPGPISPYRFRMSSTLQPGDQIWSVNGDWAPVPNTVTLLNHEADIRRFEYTSTSVGRGFSGGPIFDSYLNVIGMHDALTGDKRFAVGIKIDSAFETLNALGINVPKVESSILGGPGTADVTHPPGGADTTISTLTISGVFQPKGLPSAQMMIVVTPDSGGTTYTARMMGATIATFTNGVVDDQQRSFRFSSVQPGVVSAASYGSYLRFTNGSLTLTFTQDAGSQGVQTQSGTVRGVAELSGSVLEGRKAGRTSSDGAGRPGEVSGEISGTYTAILVPKATRSNSPAEPPGIAAQPGAPPPSREGLGSGEDPRFQAAQNPCIGGCNAMLGDLKVTARYSYPHPTYASLTCEEKVFHLPANWPGGPYLHSIVCVGPNANGIPVKLINFRLAATDRIKDQDSVIVFSDGNGHGSFLGAGKLWRVKIYGIGSLESMTIQVSR